MKSVLEDVRENVHQHHGKWYKSAVELHQKLNGFPPSIPRRCGRQTQRDNVPATTTEEYYRRSLTVPFLDHMISHMETRFSNLQQKAIMALKIIPSVIVHNSMTAVQSDGDNITNLLDFFIDDVPSPSNLSQEIELWRRKWQNHVGEIPEAPTTALVHATQYLFPNVHCLLRLISTLPVTSWECERSVSVLRRLKTYLGTTMGQTRLTGLALLHTHYSTDIDLDKVIDIFNGQHPRRISLRQ